MLLALTPAIWADHHDDLPGEKLRQKGASKHFPVVIVPGITSTNLENWTPPSAIDNSSDEDGDCFKFRQKVWGDIKSAGKILTNKQCWMEYLMLGPDGLDPVFNNRTRKLRPPRGLSAADYFVQGFWVWAKVIENMASVGYDINDIHMAAYDWRLSFPNLEVRDSYFTNLMAQIEFMRSVSGKKVVIVAHSLGGNLVHYLMKFSEIKNQDWVNGNVEAILSIAAPYLGAPKSVPSVLSGEMLNTAQLSMPIVGNLLESTFGRNERQQLFRSWDGVSAMLPKGGSKVWPGSMISISRNQEKAALILNSCGVPLSNLTAPESIQLMRCIAGENYVKRVNEFYSDGISDEPSRLNDSRYWSNPLESKLPDAPNMRLISLYGVGKPAERAYSYTAKNEELIIDVREDNMYMNITNGVKMTNGDGTVPLVSLGFMAHSGWRTRLNASYPAYPTYGHIYNPHKVGTVVREYMHAPDPALKSLRGGPATADHVDILGNAELITDILRVMCHFEAEKVSDRTYSEIESISSSIQLF